MRKAAHPAPPSWARGPWRSASRPRSRASCEHGLRCRTIELPRFSIAFSRSSASGRSNGRGFPKPISLLWSRHVEPCSSRSGECRSCRRAFRKRQRVELIGKRQRRSPRRRSHQNQNRLPLLNEERHQLSGCANGNASGWAVEKSPTLRAGTGVGLAFSKPQKSDRGVTWRD